MSCALKMHHEMPSSTLNHLELQHQLAGFQSIHWGTLAHYSWQNCCSPLQVGRHQKANHSLQVTPISRRYQSGVDEQLIMEQTGHQSAEGVRWYKRTSDTHCETLSDILNGLKKLKCIVGLGDSSAFTVTIFAQKISR